MGSKKERRCSPSKERSVDLTLKKLRIFLTIAFLGLILISVESIDAKDSRIPDCLGLSCELIEKFNEGSERIATEHFLPDFDTNGDGILETVGEIRSGDIIYRSADGVTQVDEGYYLVPNNSVYADINGDGIVGVDEVLTARIVVVADDNLTYVFREGTGEVQAVFPNGTGKAGANSVARVGVVTAILGEAWGQNQSELLFAHLPDYYYSNGIMPNYFGTATLGIQYYIDDQSFVNTQQEIHGTFERGPGKPDGASLLGERISGGCIRHQNHAANYMARIVRYGDIVLTVHSAAEDSADNKFDLYNRTRIAANLPPISLSEELTSRAANYAPTGYFLKPANESLRPTYQQSDQITWRSFDVLGRPTTFNEVLHPYNRAHYHLLPCGAEKLFITAKANGIELLHNQGGEYSLILPDAIINYDGSELKVDDFYDRRSVNFAQVKNSLYRLSLGDPEAAIFQYLYFDLAYQYATYLAQQSAQRELSPEELEQAVAQLNLNQLRRVQQVTGLIPNRFSYSSDIRGVPGDNLASSLNWTMMRNAMNVFYGQEGETYEIDYRHSADNNSFRIRDRQIWVPSTGNEVDRTGDSPLSHEQLVRNAINEGRPAVFLVSRYRHLADKSFFNNMAAGHFFALIPEYTDLDAQIIGIYDTMNPYQMLLVPMSEIPFLFTSITIAPRSAAEMNANQAPSSDTNTETSVLQNLSGNNNPDMIIGEMLGDH